MWGYQCRKCSHERITSHDYTASCNDNTRGDINTAAGRTQELPGIHTIYRNGYSFYIDECDECNSSETEGSKCVKEIKSTSNGATAEESPSVEISKDPDNSSIVQNDDNVAVHSSRDVSKEYVTCTTCPTKIAIYEPLSKQLADYIRNHKGDKSSLRTNTGEKSCSQVTETVHSPDHKEKISFLCSKCGRAFSRRHNRDRHNIAYSGKKSCTRIGYQKAKSS